MTEQININYSTARKYLVSTGLRASKEAILKMQELVRINSMAIAEKAKLKVAEGKGKTIMPEHLE